MAEKPFGSYRRMDIAPSNTKQSSDHLSDVKHLTFRDEVTLVKPTQLDVLLQSIFKVAGVESPLSDAFKTAELEAVLNEKHDCEKKFDEKLFLALRNCLLHHGLIQTCRDPTDDDLKKVKTPVNAANTTPEEEAKRNIALEPIVFNFGLSENDVDGPMYALGIASQGSGEPESASNSNSGERQSKDESASNSNSGERQSAASSSGKKDSTSSGLAAKSKLDHCSCLLERATRNGKWKVAKIFSVVELKISTDSQGAVIEVDSDNKVRHVDLTQGGCGAAISQALIYTLGWALPSHADSGELKDVSWAAIIGKKKVKNKTTEKAVAKGGDEGTINNNKTKSKKAKTTPPIKYRWMLGKLYVPEKCGGLFEFSVTRCGILEDNDSGTSSRDAVSAYIETLVFGLRVAKRLQQAIKDKKRIVRPSSGKKLKFGQVELELKLRGKPKAGDALIVDSRQEQNVPQEFYWVISQGEIFTGKINCSRLSHQPREDAWRTLLIFKDDDEEVDVAVKVSSLSVHRYLNHPDKAWLALKEINSAFAHAQSKRIEAEKSNEEKSSGVTKKWDLFNVLYAAETMPNALITVMADLSKDYKVLTPKKDKISFDELWTAYRDLVARILFPLAELWVIHPDIRPGWNFTANILYKMNHSSEKPAMQLIDFESLVVYNNWIPPVYPKFKYIKKKESWSCYTFLFWQCVTLGHAWKREKSQEEMEEIDVQGKFFTDEKGDSISYADACEWEEVYRMEANEFDAFLQRLGDVLST